MIRGGTPLWPPPACAADAWRRMKKWLSVGVQVSASASDVRSAMPTVIASALKNVPVTPVIDMSGRNTTIGVIVDPTSGTRISAIALRMASARSCPASRCITMFSTTTIASSMTRPTAAARPPSVMRLKLAERAQHDERDRERRRNHEAGDERGAPVAQEQHHDERRQHEPDEDRVAHALD